jgi:hypothetical protein
VTVLVVAELSVVEVRDMTTTLLLKTTRNIMAAAFIPNSTCTSQVLPTWDLISSGPGCRSGTELPSFPIILGIAR